MHPVSRVSPGSFGRFGCQYYYLFPEALFCPLALFCRKCKRSFCPRPAIADMLQRLESQCRSLGHNKLQQELVEIARVLGSLNPKPKYLISIGNQVMQLGNSDAFSLCRSKLQCLEPQCLYYRPLSTETV